MYQPNGRELIVELTDIPQSSVGAPCPEIMAAEHSLVVKYYIQDEHPELDETTTVRFNLPYAHIFGPPNDEAFRGHPLYGKGLRPYSAVEVCNSPWIEALEKMNSVHPYHDKVRFLANKRHFVLSFHDTTFECIAESYVKPKATSQQGGQPDASGAGYL